MKAADLLQDGAPVAPPRYCDSLFVTTSLDELGAFAVSYWAYTREHEGRRYARLILLDFDDSPLSGATYETIRRRLVELMAATLTRVGVSAVYAPEPLCGQFERVGLLATPLPRAFADPTNMIVAASTHVRAGEVKLSTAAHERASTTGLGGALTFRVSDSLRDNALRTSLVTGVVAALEEVNYLAAAFQPA